MNALFTINGNTKSASEWGIVSAKIIKRCSGLDELKINFSSPEYVKNFQIGGQIETIVNGVRKFCGNIVKAPIKITGKTHNASLTAYNAWSDLDEIVYQQKWTRMYSNSIGSFYRSKVILGQNSSGEKVSVGEQIVDIANHAIMCGANFKIGNVDLNVPMLFDETRDISCAQAILRTLKWAPNAAIFFDYSKSGTPILNILKRASLEKICIDTSLDSVLTATVTPRPDLSLDGVSIKYEQENIKDSKSTLVVSEDNYPANVSSHSKRVLVMSVDLDGRKLSCDTYNIVSEPINLDSAKWWRKHIPSLSEVDIEVLESSISDDTHSLELIEGNIASGMNFQKQRVTAKAKIKYTRDDGVICTKNIATRILTTNALSGTYSIWRTTQYAEPKPIGLAKSIYDACANLIYEGSIEISNALEKDFIGKSISIKTPEEPNWLSLNSTSIFVEEDIEKQRTIIKFGPPKHLHPDQIAEYFRISRNRKVSDSSSTRTTAQNNSSVKDMTTHGSIENGTEGDVSYERLLISSTQSDEISKNIDINAGDLEQNETAQMRKIYLCHNGYLASAKLLMTEPFIEEISE